MSSLKKLAIRGTIWTILGYGGGQFLRLGGNLILTRLLVPELFGLMTLINTLITGLNLFSDIGIRPSIIRSSRHDDPLFINTAWTLQAIRGIVIWIFCLIIAIPAANFYGEPRLAWLIPIVGYSSVFAGFGSTSLATLNRKVQIATLTKFDFCVQTISLTVMILWSFVRPTIWALVGGNFISSLIKMIWSYRLDKSIYNGFFGWEKKSLKELITFGRWIFISTAITFLSLQADRLILGKLFTLEMLGVYSIAFMFSDLPRQIVQTISKQVIYPIIAQQIDLPRNQLRRKILAKRWLLLMGLAILVALMFSAGDLWILQLYDDRYKEAAWMLPILALGIWPSVLVATIDRTLYVLGKPIYNTIGYILKFLYMIILLPWAYQKMGVLGVVFVVAFNDIPVYMVVGYGLFKEKLNCILQDLQSTGVLILIISSFLIIRWLGNFGFFTELIPR